MVGVEVRKRMSYRVDFWINSVVGFVAELGVAWFIVLAMFLQLIWFLVAGLNYKTLYKLLGLDETVRKLVLLNASANFVNTIAPTGGAGGMAVFISAASKDGHPVGKVTVASMLFLFVEFMPASDLRTLDVQRFPQSQLHARLLRPAFLICRQSQIAISDHDHRFGHSHILAWCRAE
jgi:hypothetical protein